LGSRRRARRAEYSGEIELKSSSDRTTHCCNRSALWRWTSRPDPSWVGTGCANFSRPDAVGSVRPVLRLGSLRTIAVRRDPVSRRDLRWAPRLAMSRNNRRPLYPASTSGSSTRSSGARGSPSSGREKSSRCVPAPVARCVEPSCPAEGRQPLRPAGRAAETRLRGWACKTRTGESVRELPVWNCVTTV
jgi:hypothetical protein